MCWKLVARRKSSAPVFIILFPVLSLENQPIVSLINLIDSAILSPMNDQKEIEWNLRFEGLMDGRTFITDQKILLDEAYFPVGELETAVPKQIEKANGLRRGISKMDNPHH